MRKLVSATLCILLAHQCAPKLVMAQDPNEVPNRCSWHLETLVKDYDARESHTFSTEPAIARDTARISLDPTAKIIFSAPVTAADMRQVYPEGKQVTASDLAETTSNRTMLKQFGREDSDRSVGKANFSKMLDSTPESYIVLVGHNERGQFHFLDGSTMDIEKIADECLKRHKVPVIISCRSKREKVVGSARDLTFAEAFCIAGRLQSVLSSVHQRHQMISPVSLQAAFSNSESSFACNGAVRFFVLAGCAGAGIAFAIVISSHETSAM